MSRPAALLVWALLVGLSVAACGGTGGTGGDDRTLPPNDEAALARIFDEELDALGLRFTRGALIDVGGGGYEASDSGTHLAVYVEPTGDYAAADYADGVVASARVFLPVVFERWPGLETFDVCQEPLPVRDDRETPPPVTQLNLTEGEASDIDWETVTLADLLARNQPERDAYRMYVTPSLLEDPAFETARRRSL